MNILQTTSGTFDISSPIKVAEYTATAPTLLLVQLAASGLDGSGVLACVTRTIGAIRYQTGVTSPAGSNPYFPGMTLPINTGDAMGVWMEGQATDVAVAVRVEVWDAYGGSLATALDAIPATIASTFAAFVETSSTDATAAGRITRRRGDSWAIVPAALGVLTGYTSLWLTIKSSHEDEDSAAILHVKKNASGLSDGLLYLNGAASTANLASITVTDAATGIVSIAVDEAATKELAPGEYYYDIQALIAGNVATPDSGTFTVTADVTRSVT